VIRFKQNIWFVALVAPTSQSSRHVYVYYVNDFPFGSHHDQAPFILAVVVALFIEPDFL